MSFSLAFSRNHQIAAIASSVIVAFTFAPLTAPAQTSEQIRTIAREITVRIDSSNPGSGVIIAKQGTTYYVATARHVVLTPDSYTVITHDGNKYPVNSVGIKKFADVDLAVVTFVSDRNYRVATISTYLAPTYERRSVQQDNTFSGLQANQNQSVFVSGFPNVFSENETENKYVFNPGRIIDTSGSAISDPSNRSEGYRLAYSNLTHAGMSGGALLDANGRLIGIHGRADGQVKAGDQVIDRTLPEAKKSFRINFGNSLAIPVSTFLTLLPNTGLQLDLKLEKTSPQSLSTSQLESWIPPQVADQRVNPIYWINLGNQYWRIGKLLESKTAFEQAISLSEKSPISAAWYAKGFVAGFERNYTEALSSCQKAVDIDAKVYDAWRCKAGAEYRLGKLSTALASLDQAIKLNLAARLTTRDLAKWRENPTDHVERGEILFALDRPNEAIAAFNKAIELDDQLVSAWANKGFVQIMTQDFSGAEASIDRALAIDANFAPAWANRGMLLYKRNRNLESVAAFDKAIELNSQDPEIWLNRGVVLYSLGRSQDAIQSIRKSIEIDPNYQPARAVLKQITGS